MPFLPTTVTIGGTDFTADVIGSVQVVNGKRAFWEETVAGQASIELYVDSPDIAIADDVQVVCNGIPIFTGVLAQIDTRREVTGTIYTLSCYGPLARAARRDVLTTLPAQLDGERVLALIDDALAVTWAEAQGTWAEQTATWAEFGVDTSQVDAPGVYQLSAITTIPRSVMEALADAAFSGQGNLYETGSGGVGYADSTRRGQYIPNGVIDIPGDLVELASLQTQQTLDDVVNYAMVDWEGGDITAESLTSQGIYGKLDRKYPTILADPVEALDFGSRLVSLQAVPRRNIVGGVRVYLDRSDDTGLLNTLLGLHPNLPIRLHDAGPQLGDEGDSWLGFLEGFDLEVGYDRAFMTLYMSDYSLSVFRLRWADVAPTVAWQDVDAMLQWQQATESL
jgi:hypothetical protein